MHDVLGNDKRKISDGILRDECFDMPFRKKGIAVKTGDTLHKGSGNVGPEGWLYFAVL